MSSPHRKNTVRLILYKSQLCPSFRNIKEYTLSFEHEKSCIFTTQLIKTSQISFRENEHVITINTHKKSHILVTAIGKPIFIIKKKIASVKIPIISSSQKQWYFLKNDNEEIVLKVLLCIRSDTLTHNNSTTNNSIFFVNNSLINNRSTISLNLNTFHNLTFQQSHKGRLLSITENLEDSIDVDDIKKEIEETNEDALLSQRDLNEVIINDTVNEERSSRLPSKRKEADEELESYYKKEQELEKRKKKFEERCIRFNREIYRNEIANDLEEINRNNYRLLNEIYYLNDNYTLKTIKTRPKPVNALIMLDEGEEENERKKLKKAYLNSKHLNSTNFTSNVSEINLNETTKKKTDSKKSKKNVVEFDNIKVVQVKPSRAKLSQTKLTTEHTNKYTNSKKPTNSKSRLKSNSKKNLIKKNVFSKHHIYTICK